MKVKLILIIFVLFIIGCSKNRVMSNIYIAEAYIKQMRSGHIPISKENKNIVLSYLNEALKEDESNTKAHYLLGQFLFLQNSLSLSLYHFNKVIDYDPDNKGAYFFIGSIYYEIEEYKKSLFYLKTLVDKDNDNYLPYNALAWLYATAKDYKYRNPKKALEYAKKAVDLSDNNPFVLDTLAEAYFVNKNYKKAVEIQEKVVKMEPNNKDFNNSLRRFKKALNN